MMTGQAENTTTGHRTIAPNARREALIRLAVMLTEHGIRAIIKIGARDAVLADGEVVYLCQLDDEDIFVTESGEVVGFVNDPALIDYFLPADDEPMTRGEALGRFLPFTSG